MIIPIAYKVRTTYVKYAFSEEATRYSKKVAKKRGSMLVGCSLLLSVVFFLLSLALMIAFMDNARNDTGELAPWVRILILCLAGAVSIVLAVWIGWKAEKAYIGRYERKIEAAITRDIVKLEGQYSHEMVEAYRKKLLEARKGDSKQAEKGDDASKIGQGGKSIPKSQAPYILAVSLVCILGAAKKNPMLVLIIAAGVIVYTVVLVAVMHFKK